MFSAVTRSLISFFIPGGLLFLCAVAFVYVDFFSPLAVRFVTFYPYIVALGALLFGWRFNRSRLVFAVLVIGVADRGALYAQGLPEAGMTWLTDLIACLLPLNLAALALVRERGFVTWHGLGRLFFIAVQPFLAFYLLRNGAQPAQFPYLSPFSDVLAGWHFWQPSLLVAVLAALVVAGQYLLTRDTTVNGFFWAMICCFFALRLAPPGVLSTLCFTTAGLVLLVSALESTYFMAFRDELTGLPSRRALNEYFLRIGRNYTVAMLDIDFFKKFNDRYGHDVGDQVLCMVASRINKVSGGGRAFRYGGEEFTLIFPGRRVDDVLPHLEQLRARIEADGFRLRGEARPKTKKKNNPPAGLKKVGVTISIGAAERTNENSKPDEVIKAADKALYRAKRRGRNQVVK